VPSLVNAAPRPSEMAIERGLVFAVAVRHYFIMPRRVMDADDISGRSLTVIVAQELRLSEFTAMR